MNKITSFVFSRVHIMEWWARLGWLLKVYQQSMTGTAAEQTQAHYHSGTDPKLQWETH